MRALIKDIAGVLAILSVCVLLYYPRQSGTQAPATHDMGPTRLYVPDVVPTHEPAPSCPAHTTPTTSKACNPACVYPEKCVEGTCCRPASGQHSELIVNMRYDRY